MNGVHRHVLAASNLLFPDELQPLALLLYSLLLLWLFVMTLRRAQCNIRELFQLERLLVVWVLAGGLLYLLLLGVAARGKSSVAVYVESSIFLVAAMKIARNFLAKEKSGFWFLFLCNCLTSTVGIIWLWMRLLSEHQALPALVARYFPLLPNPAAFPS